MTGFSFLIRLQTRKLMSQTEPCDESFKVGTKPYSPYLQVFTMAFMSCRLELRVMLAGCSPWFIWAASWSSMICWAACRRGTWMWDTIEGRRRHSLMARLLDTSTNLSIYNCTQH